MWNILNLKCPTEDLCQYNILEEAILRELPSLVSQLTTSAEVLTEDNPIWEEINLFRNVQEKYKRILQCDKCLQLLYRVGNCLRKMVLLNLSKIYLDLAEQFLAGLQSQSLPILLPSCQQLEYVLLRTQSAAKLICEALHYSRETFCFLIQRLRMGHLILNLIMATSVTARVNIAFRHILVQIFDIYKKLYLWREKLKKGTTEWPKPLDLPDDLEAWLSSEASDLLKPQQVPKGKIAFLSKFFEKQKNGVKPIESDKNDDECVIVAETSQGNIDIGEVIPRPKKHKKNIKRNLEKSQNILLGKIQNAVSLNKLRLIWNRLDFGSRFLSLKALTPYKVREIEGEFRAAKKEIKKIKESDVTTDIKKEQKIAIIQSTGKKLAEHLGLMETESGPSTSSVKQLKPVKKLRELRLLYTTLHQKLQSTQRYEECAELEKKYKDRRADIKLLIRNDERKIARTLIACTSGEFITRFNK